MNNTLNILRLKAKKVSKGLSLIACILLISSCELNELWDKDYMFTIETPRDGLLIHDCSSYQHWHFFSFAQDSIIGSCDAGDSLAYDAWYNRTDWDLAFHRQNVKTNSGASGVGKGGMLAYKQEVFDFNTVTEAPDAGYEIDVPDSVIYDMSQMALGEIGYAYTGIAKPANNWAVLADMMSGLWTYAQTVFIVRTADGKFAKIYLKNFKSDTGASGTVTMEYVYQADGTLNLDIKE